MSTVTGGQLILDAFSTLNVTQPNDTITTLDAATPGASTDAPRRLNQLVGSWRQQALTIPAIGRSVFPLVAFIGGPNDAGVSGRGPYTIGSGGSLNTTKPPNQQSIVAAGLLLNSSTPPVEIQRNVATPSAYDAIKIKDLTSTLFTTLYYRPDYSTGLGAIFLYPVPDNPLNSLVLYTKAGLVSFTDVTTSYEVPDAYEEALHYNLAARLATPYGRNFTATINGTPADVASFRVIKLSNVELYDMANDFSSIGRAGKSRYNLQTGE